MNLTIEKWKDKNLHLATNNERHKMNNNSSKEADLPLILKEEGNSTTDNEKAKASASSSSLASQWTRLKDPRIVRVSRAFGGKDRHSKVCTIRGLRDRRVRLSVPTAIQLYDLQNRLGLNQPSKVVDWLLNAAKHEIDELPPLPNFPTPGNFPFNTYPSGLITSNEANTSQLNQHLLNINRSIHELDGSSSSQNSIWKFKPKEVSREIVTHHDKANYWMNRSEEDDNKQRRNDNEGTSAHGFPNNNNILLQRENHPSFLSLLNTMPVSNNYQWEPSIDVNTQLGNHGFVMNNVIRPLPSTLSLSTGNSQMMGATTQSYFPSHVAAMEMDHQRQILNHHYQMLSSSSQNPLTNSLNNPFSLAMMTTPKFFHSTNSRESPSNKDQDFTPK